MSLIFQNVIIDSQHAWGYLFPEDMGVWAMTSNKIRKIIYFHNACNATSIALSPLVGVVRGTFALYQLYKLNTRPQKSRSEQCVNGMKRFMKMQLVRSGLEICFLGVVLGSVVDITVTVSRQEGGCCQQEEQKPLFPDQHRLSLISN